MACTVGRVEDLVVENGEVEGKTKTDGVGGGELGLGNVGGALFGEWLKESGCKAVMKMPYLVCLVSGGSSALALLATGELGKVTVVVTLPAVGCQWAVLCFSGRWKPSGNTYILW